MAAGTKEPKEPKATPDEQDAMEIPEQWPADQLFVGVGEGMSEVVGHDGGATTNGRGMWYKGQVGHWTSKHPVPLALRDPESGLIWKGYLEPVLQTQYNANGVLIAVGPTRQFFVSPDEMPRPKKEAKKLKAVAPVEKAAKRAKDGPTPIDAGIKKQHRTPLATSAAATGRVNDLPVG